MKILLDNKKAVSLGTGIVLLLSSLGYIEYDQNKEKIPPSKVDAKFVAINQELSQIWIKIHDQEIGVLKLRQYENLREQQRYHDQKVLVPDFLIKERAELEKQLEQSQRGLEKQKRRLSDLERGV